MGYLFRFGRWKFGVLLTTLKATRGMDRRLYVGALGKVFRIDNPHTGDPEWQDVSVGLPRGGYVTDIAIDPRNADKFAVVISNYKTYSIFYTTDAGLTYSKVAVNLKKETVEAEMDHLAERWSFIH